MQHPLGLPARLLLLPLWPLYRLLAGGRAACYRWGLLATRHAGVPVISVGNLTLGGSGKTPVTEYLARVAAKAGLRPAVVSRGYGRRGLSAMARWKAAEGTRVPPALLGDEPFLLATRNPDLPVVVGADRVEAARLARTVDRPGVIILDDGYQHLRLARDLNVLLVDATTGMGNRRVLPWGILREPVTALARADVVLITKAGADGAQRLAAWLRSRVAAPVFLCGYRAAGLRRLDGAQRRPPEALEGREVSLVCAIADPASLARTVTGRGARIEETLALRDHHPYGAATLRRLESRLAGAGEEAWWVTTEKDAVKLEGRVRGAEKVWVLEMEVAPEPAAAAFFFDFLSGLPLE